MTPYHEELQPHAAVMLVPRENLSQHGDVEMKVFEGRSCDVLYWGSHVDCAVEDGTMRVQDSNSSSFPSDGKALALYGSVLFEATTNSVEEIVRGIDLCSLRTHGHHPNTWPRL